MYYEFTVQDTFIFQYVFFASFTRTNKIKVISMLQNYVMIVLGNG